MDILSNYLLQIGNNPRLTFKREQELAEIIKNKHPEFKLAIKELVEAHLKLVVSIALQYKNFNIPLSELISDGNFGLMKAAVRIKPSTTRFSTYAVFWIRQSILAQAPARNKSITVPCHVQSKIRKIMQAEQDILSEFGRAATYEEISCKTGINAKKVQAFKDCQKPLVAIDSDHLDSLSSHELISATTAAPYSETSQKETMDLIIQSLAKLTAKEQIVIAGRFGIGCEEETLESLGNKLTLSRERIRQLEASALKKLKHLSKHI